MLLGLALLRPVPTLLDNSQRAGAANSFPRSVNVALVIGSAAGSVPVLPTAGTVIGGNGASYSEFTFTQVSAADLPTVSIASYDTIVLYQLEPIDYSPASTAAISTFLTSGGKVVLYDSDGTANNDYSWLPVPATTGTSCPNCGDTGGSAQVVENNTLVSADSSDLTHYVPVSDLPGATDAIGDGNVMTTQDPAWFVDIRGTNGRGETGAIHTYATTAGGGLIIYNGFDQDGIGASLSSGIDVLGKLWYLELAQGWDPDHLPHGVPVAEPGLLGLGDSIAAGHGLGPSSGRPDNATAYPYLVGLLSKTNATDYAVSGACADRANSSAPFAADSRTPTGCNGTKSVAEQVDDAAAAHINPKVVTLTVGADDIRFSDCFRAIAGLSGTDPCSGTLFNRSLAAFSTNLNHLLGYIGVKFPDAKIVITTVYNPLPRTVAAPNRPCVLMRLGYLAQDWRNRLWQAAFHSNEFLAGARAYQNVVYSRAVRIISSLNSVIRRVALSQNASVADLAVFDGHDLCGQYENASYGPFEYGPSGYVDITAGLGPFHKSFSMHLTPAEDCAYCPDDPTGTFPVNRGIGPIRITGTGGYAADGAPHPNFAGQLTITVAVLQQL